MHDDLKAELERIVQAVAFGPGGVTLAGYASPYAGAAGASPGMLPADPLVAQLQQLLYERCYCYRFGDALPEAKPASADDARFV
jgi:hypothetical protein